ncbi:uncharacterized protein LOC122639234 [Telopea speciosissima]|uniref:uncharacterized protein LOC122639234 n=1 Tax=Telopea speciosissima TaxID=54955 RepID=UPI001CC731E3|nr:uncharacterized protein LOC122639234 [Telopea speciosissima]
MNHPSMETFEESDTDEDVFLVDENSEGNSSHTWDLTLVGFIIAGKPYRRQAIDEALLKAWNTRFPITVALYDKDLYLFHLQHGLDLQNVINEGPWSVSNNLIILENWGSSKDWSFTHYLFWIQLHAVPEELLNLDFAAKIATRFGSPSSAMIIRSFKGGGRLHYIRLRVLLDITNPIKQHYRLQRRDGSSHMLFIKYAKLPLFCFYCGIIGHEEQRCTKLYDEELHHRSNVQRWHLV